MSPGQSGSRIDHYAIEELVAKSNTASIYRATDLDTGRRVALKVPHPEVEGDLLFYNRFCREREIGIKLDHPSVVKVYRAGHPSVVYMALEWVEGQLLRKILDAELQLSQDRALKIAIGVAEALEYIHSQGVVHRDLKPENIMMDSADRVKLIDFGIASEAGARRLTFGKLSQVMGTPDYISPEQVKGKRGDARSDIYALGIMLYEMLTGKTPFSGNNPFVVMNSRLVNHPAPPREIDPEISPQLQEIIYRALERDPKHRYASARELSWDLRHQDQVGIAERRELADWTHQRPAWARRVVLYGTFALIPVVIFILLLYVAKHP
jgi:serine/threonine-protein kinase